MGTHKEFISAFRFDETVEVINILELGTREGRSLILYITVIDCCTTRRFEIDDTIVLYIYSYIE